MSPTIREAHVSDAQAISRLIGGLVDYFLADPGSPELAPFLETLTPAATAERIESSNFDYLVAEDRSGILGVIAIRDDSHVYHLFVQSDAHRRGVARALWEHARARAACTEFTVNSSPYAVPVYERLGFKAVDTPQTKDGLVFVPMEFQRTL